MSSAHPAFAGPSPLPPVSNFFAATHPAMAAWRQTQVDPPLEATPAQGKLSLPLDGANSSGDNGYYEEVLVLAPEWAEKFRTTYERLTKPKKAQRSKATRHRRRPQGSSQGVRARRPADAREQGADGHAPAVGPDGRQHGASPHKDGENVDDEVGADLAVDLGRVSGD